MAKKIQTYYPSAIRSAKAVYPPKDESSQNILADEMLEWVKNENILTIDSFPISKSMAPCRVYRIAETNDYFSMCLELAKSIISDRLILRWSELSLPKDFVLRILPMVNEEYRLITMEKFKITEDSRHQAAIINLTIPPITSSKDAREATRDKA